MKFSFLESALFLTAMVVEGSWLYAIIEVINRKVHFGQISVPLLLVFLPVSLLVNLLVRRLRWPQFFQNCLGWTVWLIALLLMIKIQLYGASSWGDLTWLGAIPASIAGLLYMFPPDITILLAGGVIWWFGQRLAYNHPDFASSVGDFQFGLIMIILTFLITAGLDMDFKPAIPVVMVFFASGLLSFSIAHARQSSGWLASVYRGSWSGVVVISIVIILILGFIVGAFFAPGLADAILAALRWTWNMIERFLTWLASLIPPPSVNATPLPGAAPEPGEGAPSTMFQMSEETRRILQIAWTVLFFGMFALALWRMSRSIMGWLRRVLSSSGAEIEPMSGAFRDDFFGLFRALLSLIWRRLHLPGGRKRRVISQEAMNIRQVYGQLLRWASSLGYPRGLAQTPNEYLSTTLSTHVPEQQPGLALITDRYVKARYGETPVSEQEIKEVKEAWERLKDYHPGKKRRLNGKGTD